MRFLFKLFLLVVVGISLLILARGFSASVRRHYSWMIPDRPLL